MSLNEIHQFIMQWGHIPISIGIVWIIIGLHRNGVKMTFDFRIWKNGRDKKEL